MKSSFRQNLTSTPATICYGLFMYVYALRFRAQGR
jgi:hypothetical protein